MGSHCGNDRVRCVSCDSILMQSVHVPSHASGGLMVTSVDLEFLYDLQTEVLRPDVPFCFVYGIRFYF
jgi:hypothetical protein